MHVLNMYSCHSASFQIWPWICWKGVADTWTLLWHHLWAKLLNKSRACNSCNNSLIRILWPSCICYNNTFFVVPVSNHNHENCRSCRDMNSTTQSKYGRFLSKWRLRNSSNKKLSKFFDLYAQNCPAYILTLQQVSNHYLQNCRSCGDTSSILPCALSKLSM